jgi:hypothetical protein
MKRLLVPLFNESKFQILWLELDNRSNPGKNKKLKDYRIIFISVSGFMQAQGLPQHNTNPTPLRQASLLYAWTRMGAKLLKPVFCIRHCKWLIEKVIHDG